MSRRLRTWVFVAPAVLGLVVAGAALTAVWQSRSAMTALQQRVDDLARPRATPAPSVGATPRGLAGPRRLRLDAHEFDAYVVDLGTMHLRTYWKDDRGHVIGSIDALRRYLASRGEELLFATNAGMFTKERRPIGLYIEDGRTLVGLDLRSAPGNFYLKPNGVFLVANGAAEILESTELRRRGLSQIEIATQSGPLLLRAGRVHGAISPVSANRAIRSGVGIMDPHTVVFAISREPVTFWEFARLFRDLLGCDDALYLDGAISLMYAPEIRSDLDGDFGAMLGVFTPMDGRPAQ